ETIEIGGRTFFRPHSRPAGFKGLRPPPAPHLPARRHAAPESFVLSGSSLLSGAGVIGSFPIVGCLDPRGPRSLAARRICSVRRARWRGSRTRGVPRGVAPSVGRGPARHGRI